MNFGFIIDNRKCIGCHACTVACKSEHDVPIGVNRTWVKYIEKGQFPNSRRIFSVMRCNHCDDAPCVDICPTRALYTRADGIVDFDNERCIGCKACTQACPYDAIYIDPNTQTAAKCNYCAHRVEKSLEPACVNVCPTEAIISGDMDNPLSKISQLLSREQTTVRKPEKGTNPKLFYIEGDDISLTPLTTKQDEHYMWSDQKRGVGHNVGKVPNKGFNLVVVPTQELPKSAEVDHDSTLSSNSPNPFQRLLGLKPSSSSDIKRVYDSPSKGVLWNWEVVGYIFTKALSTGIFVIPLLINHFIRLAPFQESFLLSNSMLITYSLISMFFLMLTGVLLIKDLDQPTRFLYVLFRPQWNSWLVKGAYYIMGFGLASTFWIAGTLMEWDWLVDLSVYLVIFFGFMTSIYTAFLFSQAKGRDLWQSPLTALHMLNHSIATGCAVLMVIMILGGADFDSDMQLLRILLIIAVLINLFVIMAEQITPHMTQDSTRAMKIITKGHYKTMFRYGVLIFGNLIPLLICLFFSANALLLVASLLIIVGVFFSIRVWVVAPQMIPLS